MKRTIRARRFKSAIRKLDAGKGRLTRSEAWVVGEVLTVTFEGVARSASAVAARFEDFSASARNLSDVVSRLTL